MARRGACPPMCSPRGCSSSARRWTSRIERRIARRSVRVDRVGRIRTIALAYADARLSGQLLHGPKILDVLAVVERPPAVSLRPLVRVAPPDQADRDAFRARHDALADLLVD